jgi:hypothetical protein
MSSSLHILPGRRWSKRRLFVLLAVVLAVSGIGAAPAKAYFSSTPVGYAGPWLGSSPGFVYCGMSLRLIRAPGPYVGRANAYTNYSQTIWMQVRLERFNWTYSRWEIIQTHQWQQQPVAPGSGYAAFWEEEFRDVGPSAYFRISYDFRWSVAGVGTIGRVFGYHHGSEYQVSGTGGFTFADGCYI